ncbi:hypothetical protein GCM10009000_082330 [Halobacterium noricense]
MKLVFAKKTARPEYEQRADDYTTGNLNELPLIYRLREKTKDGRRQHDSGSEAP